MKVNTLLPIRHRIRDANCQAILATIKPAPHTPPHRADKQFVSRFMENATSIFETAETAMTAGHVPTDMTIVIGQEGGIRLIADSDWPLDNLQAHLGAEMVYRVRQQDNSLRLEGRAGSRTCLFETAKLNGVARKLLAGRPQYDLMPGTIGPRHEGILQIPPAAWD
jgi:hypothetical protein